MVVKDYKQAVNTFALILFLDLSLMISLVHNIFVLLVFYFVFVLIAIYKYRSGYFKETKGLYQSSFLVFILNLFFYKSSFSFNIQGLVYSSKIVLKILSISTLGYLYKNQTTYYDIFKMFYSYNAKVFKTFALAIILIFKFIDSAKKSFNDYNFAYRVRFKRYKNKFRYVIGFAVCLIKSLSEQANSLSIAITTKRLLK